MFTANPNLMHPNEMLIRKFYQAFGQKDYQAMQQSYHPDAFFSDPVFPNLSAAEVKAMWKMLVTSGRDLVIIPGGIQADDNVGQCRWEARYTFSGTGRKVRNVIHAQFKFKNGLILRHEDKFDFWKWSRMALGASGLLLGWSPYLLNAVRQKARRRLERFMKAEDSL